MEAVEKILRDLDMDRKPTLRVFNKADLFPDKGLLATLCSSYGAIALSATEPDTLSVLLEKLESFI